MKTLAQWNGSKLNFTDFVNDGDEIDEEMYDYFLGVVPPEYSKEGIFCCGEPSNHDRIGNPMYDTFKCVGDRYWYCGSLTIRQAKSLV
jgi:hypothetical protein